MDNFINNDQPTIFVRGNFLIFDVNEAFCDEFSILESEM